MCSDHDSAPPIGGGPAPPTGEPVTLASTAPDGAPLAAFSARPHTPTGAGVVVLPDLRGLCRFYRELAVRLAGHGHTAIAIDYYGRSAGLGDRGDDFAFMEHTARLSREGIQGDLGAGIAWLRDAAGGGCRAVFTLGFCMGGRASFLASIGHLGLAGAIGFYGAPGSTGPYRDPGPTQLAGGLTAPVLALMGGADEGIPISEVEAFDAALTAAGVQHEVVVYPDAPHGFFDLKQAQFADASADAWRRTLQFIRQHTTTTLSPAAGAARTQAPPGHRRPGL
jgi:carboxymethylenebutenolidase